MMFNSVLSLIEIALRHYMKKSFTLSLIFLLCTISLFGQCDRASLLSKKSLVGNGDFKMGDAGFKTLYRKSIQVYENYGAYSIVKSDGNQTFLNQQLAEGNYLLADVSKRSSDFIWKQKIKIKPNRQYYFSIDVANMSAALSQEARAELLVTFNGDAFAFRIDAPLNHDEWMTGETMYLSGEEKEITIEIYGLKTNREGNDIGIDNILFIECGKIKNINQDKNRLSVSSTNNRIKSKQNSNSNIIGIAKQVDDSSDIDDSSENEFQQNVNNNQNRSSSRSEAFTTFQNRKAIITDTLNIAKQEIDIFLWDDNVMDGDIISIYLNGKVVLDKHPLKKERFRFKLSLAEGENTLSLFAENMGMIPPNTVSMIIKDDNGSYRLRLESDFKTNDSLILDYRK